MLEYLIDNNVSIIEVRKQSVKAMSARKEVYHLMNDVIGDDCIMMKCIEEELEYAKRFNAGVCLDDRITAPEKSGYASIDKPWLKYYSKETPELPSSDMSMYDFLLVNNKDNLNSIALNYFGRKISYQELFDNIDKVASSLCAYGVKQGDIVSVCPLNTPEFVYLLYAINKIGAVSNWIGLTSPEQDLREQLLTTSSKMVFSVDVASDLVSAAARDAGAEIIVSVPVYQSMPAVIRTIARIKNGKSSPGTQWKEFISKGVGAASEASFSVDDMAMIQYTGGSTGVPKGVMLSNKNLNAYYINIYTANAAGLSCYKKGDTYLSCVPFFLGFGMSACLHGPLCHGMTLILAPDPAPESLGAQVIKMKPNHIVAGRVQIEGVVSRLYKLPVNLTFIKSILYGGEPANASWESTIRACFRKFKFEGSIQNGYGMTETTGCVLVATTEGGQNLIPIGGVNVKIVNPDSVIDEYGFDTEGELCLCSDTIMMRYLCPIIESEEIVFEENGKRWIKTQDLAKVSEDGFIQITGRLKRVFHKISPEKLGVRVYPLRVENAILDTSIVEKCAVIGVEDKKTAFKTVAFMVLKDYSENEEEIKLRIDSFCRKTLPDSHIPDEYIFVKDFPLTRAGKVDYRELERRAAGGKENE